MWRQNYFVELVNACQKNNYICQGDIKTANGEFSLYKVILNPEISDRTICITAGIHGDEHSGPLAVLNFINNYKANPGDPRIILLPVLNPFGFLEGIYHNYDDVNLNRKFDREHAPRDVQLIKKLIEHEEIDFLASLHEDDEMDGSYIYQYGDQDRIFENIISTIGNHTNVCLAKYIYGDSAERGIIRNCKPDGSLDEWVFNSGIANAACIEFSDRNELPERADSCIKLIESIVEIYASKFVNV
jgi:hypothetical protein